MIRTFYPIGQGAFYSEKHDGINVVYDCGSKSSKNKVDKKIESAFNNETIDILFISHYDDDHINKIHLLLQHNTVDIVVLPLLHNEDKILLYNFYLSLGFDLIAKLINNPNDFFSDGTKIIFISPFESDDSRENNENTITLKEIKSGSASELRSYSKILINDFWEYIPYNHSYFERNQQFIALLNDNHIDVENLRTDVNYGLKNKSIIKSIYKKISGNINENSLLVYSGPTNNIKNFYLHHPIDSFWRLECNRVACVFSGDSNFNTVDIKAIFHEKWHLVGTVQIPHHGSKKDFNENFLDENHTLICPISFGNENTFGHPNIQAIETIKSKYSTAKLISENTETTYIQIIKYIA